MLSADGIETWMMQVQCGSTKGQGRKSEYRSKTDNGHFGRDDSCLLLRKKLCKSEDLSWTLYFFFFPRGVILAAIADQLLIEKVVV